MVFLHGHGVSTSKSVRIFKKYGDEAVKIVSENSYRLAEDIRGIGFKSADTIAMNLGVEKTAMFRARAGISYALGESSGNEGHCCLARNEPVKLAVELLDIPEAVINEAIDEELKEGNVVEDVIPKAGMIYLTPLFLAERNIVRLIAEALSECSSDPGFLSDPVQYLRHPDTGI